MVTALHETFQQLRHITASTVDRVDPSALGTLLHIDVNVMLDLFDGDADDWTHRNIKEFLNWAANTPLAISALAEDSQNLFLKEALKQLNTDVSLALLTSVHQHRDTFVSQAVRANNERAVNLALSLIPNSKGDFLCKRETISSSRASSTSSCHYDSSSEDSRRASARRSRYCYIHGPTVWSYINTLNIQLPAGLSKLNEDSCENYCEGHNRCEYN